MLPFVLELLPLQATKKNAFMIQSMTGYGKSDVLFNGKKIHAEIKSLNSKSLDLSTRIAPIYREKEMTIRQMISQRLERGKVDFTLWVEKDATSAASAISQEVVAAYVSQVRELCSKVGIEMPKEELLPMIMRMPETLQAATAEELTAEEWQAAENAVVGAIDALVAFRQQEGMALYGKFEEKLARIAALQKDIEPYEKQRVEKIRQRLEERLAELVGVDYDKNRLEQELIFYIEKLDISEEKQRLTNHLSYFKETMDSGSGQGKKLGFIAQEMGREINTTGSKSNLAEMQNIVVMMKDELEQIKEQVLNVL